MTLRHPWYWIVLSLISITALFVGIIVERAPTLASAADNPDPIAGSCPNVAEPTDEDMPELKGTGKVEVASYLIGLLVHYVDREKSKGGNASQYAADLHDCFPQYNVMVAQRAEADSINFSGMLAAKKVDIGGSEFWIYIFKSGFYTKPGDKGTKNWNWAGVATRESEDTISFTSPTVTFSTNWYTTGLDDYNSTAKCSVAQVSPARFWIPDGKASTLGKAKDAYDLPTWDTGSGEAIDYAKSMQNAVASANHCWPDHNVVITKDNKGSGSNSRFDVSSLRLNGGIPAYTKKISLGTSDGEAATGYTLHVFDTGVVRVLGDGGWINWGYQGRATSSADHRTVQFADPGRPDLNEKQSWHTSKSNFSRRPGSSECDADNSSGSGTKAQQILAKLRACFTNKKIIVLKHIAQFEFIQTEDLMPLYSADGYTAFALNAGYVLNLGDGGFENWAATGAEKGPQTTEDGDLYMHFESADDGDGEPDNTGLENIPFLGVDPATFTVNTGSGSFSASQPKDSVATYVLKGGKAQSVTVTSADESGLKYKMDKFAVSSSGSPLATVTVNPNETHQTVDGFGGAMTSSAAHLIGNSSKRDEILSKLFGTGDGAAGLSIVRSPMGSSDLQASDDDSVHTYEDSKGSFGVDSNAADARQISVLQQAKSKAGSDFKLLGTPWTAPGWAKKGGKLTGNSCGTDENELDRSKVGDYADYFAKYVSAYSSKGLTPWMVSMQNEPENCKTKMPTTLLNADDEVALSKALKAKLPGGVGVLGWDHNWNDPDYVNTLTSKGTVDAIGYHCYDGTHYGAQTTAKKTLMTECSGFTDRSSNVAENLGWEVSNLLIGPMRNNSTGSVYWSLAQDSNGNPHLSTDEACQNCRGLLTVNSDGSYAPSQDFYFYGQFGKFVRPGAVRIGSNNTGDLSTVAFKNPDGTTVLVVLNSSHHADGGEEGSSESSFTGKIVQWDNEGNGQNPSWLVGADGYRRWINDISTYQCLKDEGGITDAGTQPGGVLDKYINLKDVWAVCGTSVMGSNSELEKGTYLKSGGGAQLSLGTDGKLVAKDASGNTRWTAPGTGDRLILQPDGNLVLYSGDKATWTTGTDGKAGAWLSVRDDGSFIVSTKANTTVWTSAIDAASYRGQIVQWDGDTASQKTSWQVGSDGKRRVIHDWGTFKCLHDAGEGDSKSVSSDTLDRLPDLNNVWATCGADRLGAQGMLTPGSYLKAGDYKLTMQTNGDLVLWKGSNTAVWSTKTNTGDAHHLTLQPDGNLVQYDNNDHAVWSTGTSGKSPGWLVLGDDGSLRLYDSGGKQVWTR